MKELKLLQILPSLDSGGVEQGTVDVANYLASKGIQNFIASNGGRMFQLLDRHKVKHYSLPIHSKNILIPYDLLTWKSSFLDFNQHLNVIRE